LARSALSTIITLKGPCDFGAVKALVEDVAVAIEEAEDDLRQTQPELISVRSLERNDTKKRGFA
jgi:hypothetical protein